MYYGRVDPVWSFWSFPERETLESLASHIFRGLLKSSACYIKNIVSYQPGPDPTTSSADCLAGQGEKARKGKRCSNVERCVCFSGGDCVLWLECDSPGQPEPVRQHPRSAELCRRTSSADRLQDHDIPGHRYCQVFAALPPPSSFGTARRRSATVLRYVNAVYLAFERDQFSGLGDGLRQLLPFLVQTHHSQCHHWTDFSLKAQMLPNGGG